MGVYVKVKKLVIITESKNFNFDICLKILKKSLMDENDIIVKHNEFLAEHKKQD